MPDRSLVSLLATNPTIAADLARLVEEPRRSLCDVLPDAQTIQPYKGRTQKTPLTFPVHQDR